MNEGQYTITLDHDRRLVRVVTRGEIARDVGEDLITNARAEAAKYQYNIFCDVRESRAKVGLADWYFLPRRLLLYRKAKTANIKAAIIVSAGRQERVYRFFETVTQNLGLSIKIFLEEEKALDWLRITAEEHKNDRSEK